MIWFARGEGPEEVVLSTVACKGYLFQASRPKGLTDVDRFLMDKLLG